MQILDHLNADSQQQEEEGEAEHQNMPAKFLSPQEYSSYKRQKLNMLIDISFGNKIMKAIVCRTLPLNSVMLVSLFYEKCPKKPWGLY